LAQACAEIKILKVTYGFRLFNFCFSSPPFFSFGFLFAAVIGLLPGLLGVKKMFKEESSRWPMFTMEQQGVVAGNLAPSFSHNFLGIFVHI